MYISYERARGREQPDSLEASRRSSGEHRPTRCCVPQATTYRLWRSRAPLLLHGDQQAASAQCSSFRSTRSRTQRRTQVSLPIRASRTTKLPHAPTTVRSNDCSGRGSGACDQPA